MKDFIFHVPTKILFGENQISHLSKEIKKYGSRVLLCYGGGSIKQNGIYDDIVEELRNNDIYFEELKGIEPNPRITSAREGLAILREKNLDFILAVGGGSVIDLSKLIAGAAFYEGDPWDIVIQKAKITQALPIGVVLTLAATGSEMDAGGVITNLETKEKLGFSSAYTKPKFSVMNPKYTYSVNAYHTAAGIADIMSHTMECYFTMNDNAFLANRLAEGVLKTCIHYGPIALKEPENYEARSNIMWASTWAINGLLSAGKSTPWSVHAMEHELSAFYDITHGVGLAILTPRWLQYILDDTTEEMIAVFGYHVFDLEPTDNQRADAQRAIDALRDFFVHQMNIAASLEEVGIGQEHLEEMAECAVRHCKGQVGGVVPLGQKDVYEIYKMSL